MTTVNMSVVPRCAGDDLGKRGDQRLVLHNPSDHTTEAPLGKNPVVNTLSTPSTSGLTWTNSVLPTRPHTYYCC